MHILVDAGLALAFFCGWAGLVRLFGRNWSAARANTERTERKLDLLLHYVGLDRERDEIDAGFPPRPGGPGRSPPGREDRTG